MSSPTTSQATPPVSPKKREADSSSNSDESASKKAKVFRRQLENVYFSFDIEADGSCPTKNNMLSFGLVVFSGCGEELESFQANLLPRPGGEAEERCMKEFWKKQPEAWEFVQKNCISGIRWADQLWKIVYKYRMKGNKIVWVANPAAYDWQWVKNYFELFKEDPELDIGYSAKCMGTLWWSKARMLDFSEEEEDAIEEYEMKQLTRGDHMAHNPECDARVQGRWFFELINPKSSFNARIASGEVKRTVKFLLPKKE